MATIIMIRYCFFICFCNGIFSYVPLNGCVVGENREGAGYRRTVRLCGQIQDRFGPSIYRVVRKVWRIETPFLCPCY